MIIRELIHLLNSQDFLDSTDEDIQFAKGAYEFPLSFKKLKENNKRLKALRNGR